jgi:endonuclease YncB( thermonuclease family)
VGLDGIDAPERRQTCTRSTAETWPCGTEAKAHLTALIAGAVVSCQRTGQDRYRRTIAVCYVSQPNGRYLNVNAKMVVDGYALAYRQYLTRYVIEEGNAQKARAGIPAFGRGILRSRGWRQKRI